MYNFGENIREQFVITVIWIYGDDGDFYFVTEDVFFYHESGEILIKCINYTSIRVSENIKTLEFPH